MGNTDARSLALKAAAKAHVGRNATQNTDPVTARLFHSIELLANAVAALSDALGAGTTAGVARSIDTDIRAQDSEHEPPL